MVSQPPSLRKAENVTVPYGPDPARPENVPESRIGPSATMVGVAIVTIVGVGRVLAHGAGLSNAAVVVARLPHTVAIEDASSTSGCALMSVLRVIEPLPTLSNLMPGSGGALGFRHAFWLSRRTVFPATSACETSLMRMP